MYKDINSRGKNIKANDLYSFVNSISKHTPVYYEKGEKLYVVDSKTAGTLSVGPGIVLKYNNDYFKKYGLDVSNLREGATIPASIVDKVANDILADKRKYVLNVLETNNIKGLSDSQIDALTSRAYSVGNISNFPNMYKQYGNTEELYKNYLSTVNGKDTIYEKELTERRNAEIDLFKNGYSSVEEAKEIISNYQNMINEEKYNSEILGELNVFDEIYMQPARKNCALLSSKSAVKILDGVDK